MNKELYEETIRLQFKTINELTAESTEWESKFYKLQDKIDKAIEYIEHTTITIYDNKYIKINNNHYVDDLLYILKGGDNE